MFEVQVPELEARFQFGKKLVRLTVYCGDITFYHTTYEENISVENGCVTLIDINNKVHKLINMPVTIDYDFLSKWQADCWQNWSVEGMTDCQIKRLGINKKDKEQLQL